MRRVAVEEPEKGGNNRKEAKKGRARGVRNQSTKSRKKKRGFRRRKRKKKRGKGEGKEGRGKLGKILGKIRGKKE